MIGEALARVTSGATLDRAEMCAVVLALTGSESEPLQVAALLAALRTRGETLDEIVGAAEAMRALVAPVAKAPPGAIDICGTGGDGSGTFNISTVSALVVAGAGVPVAKAGNRAASSQCGSAEVLEALGVRIDLPPAQAATAVAEVGIGFLYARACHPAFASVGPIRAALKIPTIFNRVGPITNPMRVRRHLLGVGSPQGLEDTARALAELGAERAWVVYGEDGVDELSIGAHTRVVSVEGGKLETMTFAPGEVVPEAPLAALRGGDARQNAEITRSILDGETGPRRDVVPLNAAAALVVAGHPGAGTIQDAVQVAAESIDSGAARATLERFGAFTRELAGGETPA